MNIKIINRVNQLSNHIINTEDTIRTTAKKYHISKSTVHKDITDRLILLDKNKYQKIKKIMNKHLETRHLHGGESTRQLFLQKKNIKCLK